jgi:hypothetical protein
MAEATLEKCPPTAKRTARADPRTHLHFELCGDAAHAPLHAPHLALAMHALHGSLHADQRAEVPRLHDRHLPHVWSSAQRQGRRRRPALRVRDSAEVPASPAHDQKPAPCRVAAADAPGCRGEGG